MTAAQSGFSLCARYAFAPNYYHYCGPERQSDLAGYIQEKKEDAGLKEILSHFETLYPYLQLIASANAIADPFDRRVVEAYWVGNTLLSRVGVRSLAKHLDQELKLRRIMKPALYAATQGMVTQGSMPHHTFHVLTIFIRTGHNAIAHTLTTMDQCRISWGVVVNMSDTQHVVVNAPQLVYNNDILTLGPGSLKTVSCVGVPVKIGDWVSIHWGYVCDVLDIISRRALLFYTKRAIALVNRQKRGAGEVGVV